MLLQIVLVDKSITEEACEDSLTMPMENATRARSISMNCCVPRDEATMLQPRCLYARRVKASRAIVHRARWCTESRVEK
jgi:hypothetical protein